ncbi:MAG: hypothetical protein ACTHMA_01560 [Thermomicrobiales bacterium]
MAICVACGAWTEPPHLVTSDGTLYSVCPECDYREPFVQWPLWWIAGSPGAGKSTLTPLLRARLPECIVFEGEAIDFWRFEGPASDYSSLYNQWLKVAWEIASNDRPVVMLATALPEQLDACTLRNRFSAMHYLGLVCAEATQAARLRARPAWRKSAAPEFIQQACGFTAHLRAEVRPDQPSITLHDTTGLTPAASADWVAAWVRRGLQVAG